MNEYVQGFALGNAAILGNVCMLPLYPGVIVVLADRHQRGDSSRATRWLGALVLGGVLTAMLIAGAVMYAVSAVFADVLAYALPVLYGAVFLFGVAMLADRSPITWAMTRPTGMSRNPVWSAFAYGLALGPLTLPCTGPLILSAFVIGSIQGVAGLADGLVYFLCFGLGFGWPLVVLPLLAAPVQRQLTSVLTRHHRSVAAVSGLLLIAIAVFGWYFDIRPN